MMAAEVGVHNSPSSVGVARGMPSRIAAVAGAGMSHEPVCTLHRALPCLYWCCGDARGREHVECRADSERVSNA